MTKYDIVVLFENLNGENEREVLERIRRCLDADYGDNLTTTMKVMVVDKGDGSDE